MSSECGPLSSVATSDCWLHKAFVSGWCTTIHTVQHPLIFAAQCSFIVSLSTLAKKFLWSCFLSHLITWRHTFVTRSHKVSLKSLRGQYTCMHRYIQATGKEVTSVTLSHKVGLKSLRGQYTCIHASHRQINEPQSPCPPPDFPTTSSERNCLTFSLRSHSGSLLLY